MPIVDSNLVQSGKVIDAAAMTANITSLAVDIRGATVAGVQCVAASGTHVGSIAIEESIDGDNWFPVPFSDGSSAIAVTNGAALNDLKNLGELGGAFLRVVYTFTSGTGTLSVWVLPKRRA
jgi:hypothetical protein